MSRRLLVGFIRRTSNYGSGDEDGPEFIPCVGGQEPNIHEVWNFGEEGITREVHLTARVEVGSGFFGEFATDCLTPSWLIIPFFGVNSINESVQWLGISDFLRTDGPPRTDNLLDPGPSWVEDGTTTFRTGQVNLVELIKFLLSCAVVLFVSFWLTSARVRKTSAVLRTASITISFEKIVWRA